MPACRRIRGQWNERPARPWPTTTVRIILDVLLNGNTPSGVRICGPGLSGAIRRYRRWSPIAPPAARRERFDQNEAYPNNTLGNSHDSIHRLELIISSGFI